MNENLLETVMDVLSIEAEKYTIGASDIYSDDEGYRDFFYDGLYVDIATLAEIEEGIDEHEIKNYINFDLNIDNRYQDKYVKICTLYTNFKPQEEKLMNSLEKKYSHIDYLDENYEDMMDELMDRKQELWDEICDSYTSRLLSRLEGANWNRIQKDIVKKLKVVNL